MESEQWHQCAPHSLKNGRTATWSHWKPKATSVVCKRSDEGATIKLSAKPNAEQQSQSGKQNIRPWELCAPVTEAKGLHTAGNGGYIKNKMGQTMSTREVRLPGGSKIQRVCWQKIKIKNKKELETGSWSVIGTIKKTKKYFLITILTHSLWYLFPYVGVKDLW